jgi:hypothetical protein
VLSQTKTEDDEKKKITEQVDTSAIDLYTVEN